MGAALEEMWYDGYGDSIYAANMLNNKDVKIQRYMIEDTVADYNDRIYVG